jgi:hypothetical protein
MMLSKTLTYKGPGSGSVSQKKRGSWVERNEHFKL